MMEWKRQLFIRRWELLTMFLVALGGFVFGIVISFIAGMGGEGTAMLGVVVSLVFVFAIMLFGGGISYAADFNLTVSMGGVRRRFVPVYLLITFLECEALFLIAFMLHAIEKAIYASVFRDIQTTDLLAELPYSWAALVLLPLFIVALQSLLGALFIRFGKVVFWGIWCVWMVICFGGIRLDRFLKYEWVARVLMNVTVEGIIVAAAVLFIVVAGIGYVLMRKQAVQY